MKTSIWVSHLFEGFHRWDKAPEDVAFLRNTHRHLFDVKVGMSVGHDDREIEFFQLQREVATYCKTHFERDMGELSCEMIAKQLLTEFDASFVEVSEDGENGAIVKRG